AFARTRAPSGGRGGKCLIISRRRRQTSGRESEANHLEPCDDLLRGDEVAFARAGTDFTGSLPGLGSGDVAFPERPGATLARPNRIDRAAALAVVEDAVAIVLLAQRPAALDHSRVHTRHFLNGLAAQLGDGRQLRVVHPDEARGTRAAVAAACAAETE